MKTLKDIEHSDRNVPRIMTPENGKEHDYSKGEPKILDEKYILHVYSEQLRKLAREWIKELEKDIVVAWGINQARNNICIKSQVDWIKHFFNLDGV